MHFHVWKRVSKNLLKDSRNDTQRKVNSVHISMHAPLNHIYSHDAFTCAMVMEELIRNKNLEIDAGTMYKRMLGMTADAAREHFPIQPSYIRQHQQKDKTFLREVNNSSQEYSTITVENTELVLFNGKIVVPYKLQGRIVAWYHEYLAHPGTTRLEKTIA